MPSLGKSAEFIVRIDRHDEAQRLTIPSHANAGARDNLHALALLQDQANYQLCELYKLVRFRYSRMKGEQHLSA